MFFISFLSTEYKSSEGKVQLTEEERQKVLDEVERQQTEFGTEK